MNLRVVIFVVVVIALLTAAATLPIVDWVRWLLTWVEENRAVSWAVFIVVYIVATVFLVPGSLLTLGAGFVFGLPIGFVIVSFASVAGASCAFLVGRFFVRGWVEGRLVNMPRFNALDRAVGEKGWLIVLLTRLSPVFPFNLLNYALGITQVRFTHYVLASWVGMIPGTVL